MCIRDRPGDEELNCEQLENAVAESQKIKRDAEYAREGTGGNVARLMLFWPAWAKTLHNADVAITAANDRIYHLFKIMKKKNISRISLFTNQLLQEDFTDFVIDDVKPEAIILGAGFGKRMLPITKKIPKPLVKIAGKTLLQNTIDFLFSLNCEKIIINTHYKHDLINEFIKMLLISIAIPTLNRQTFNQSE